MNWLMMVRAESYTPVVLDKVRLLYDTGKIYEDRLHNNEAAKQLSITLTQTVAVAHAGDDSSAATRVTSGGAPPSPTRV